MDGFYVGDIIGNSYTHENEKYNLKTKDFELFTERSKFSDDTILSFATIYWLLHTQHESSEMVAILKKFYEKNPDKVPTMYGEFFVNWITSAKNDYRKSSGNGGAMRSSVIGWYTKNIKELKRLVYNAIMPTHNEQGAITASEIVAICVFLFRNNHTKDDVLSYIENNYNYDLHENIDSYRNYYTYTSDAKETARPALISLFN